MNLGFAKRALLALALLAPAFLADARPVCACSTKIFAYAAAMKSDLKNLATAQEAYRADYARYTTEFPRGAFTPTAGVTVEIIRADSTSWAARTTHTATPQKCAIATGSTDDPHDGEVICDPHPTVVAALRVQFWSFMLFLGLAAIGLIGLIVGHARAGPVVALLVLVNPYWLDATSGVGCGMGTGGLSLFWIGIGAALAFWSLKSRIPAHAAFG